MPHHQKSKKINPPVIGSKAILLGEDDLDDEELLKELFSSIDPSLSLVFINNGKKLIEYLQKVDEKLLPSLVILDYNMPELNGAEILKELKTNARFSSIPKIIWSTSQSEIFKKKCLDSGANDYIIKPSRVNELVETIKYMLSFRR